MKIALTEKQVETINKILNSPGSKQVEIRVRGKEIIIFKVDSKRVDGIE